MRRERQCLDALVDRAIRRRISGSSDERVISDSLWRGEPIPDRYLPGRMILALASEERAMLATLRSSDIATDRIRFFHC